MSIVHYGFTRCYRVSQSNVVTKMHLLVHKFDNDFVVREGPDELLGQKVKLEAFVDSHTLFKVIAKNSSTVERKLKIDAYALRASYR